MMELITDLSLEVHMEICLSELIKHAEQCLLDLGFSSGTISDYRCSAFHPLERRLKDQEIISPETLLAQEDFFFRAISRR